MVGWWAGWSGSTCKVWRSFWSCRRRRVESRTRFKRKVLRVNGADVMLPPQQQQPPSLPFSVVCFLSLSLCPSFFVSLYIFRSFFNFLSLFLVLIFFLLLTSFLSLSFILSITFPLSSSREKRVVLPPFLLSLTFSLSLSIYAPFFFFLERKG